MVQAIILLQKGILRGDLGGRLKKVGSLILVLVVAVKALLLLVHTFKKQVQLTKVGTLYHYVVRAIKSLKVRNLRFGNMIW